MNHSNPNAERDERWQEILVAYLEACESGSAPSPAEWLDRHPEFSAELREFFTAQEHFAQLAAPRPDDVPPDETPRRETRAHDARLTLVDHTVEGIPTGQVPQAIDRADQADAIPAGDRASARRVHYFGDYELLDEVARGGMGVVYRARQTKLNRLVALKLILAGRLADREDVQRFHAEAEAAASLDHPGIVPVYEVGEHDGQHYFSMAFVEGESLSERLHDGPLPPRQAALLAKQIADAVAFAHRRGVVHRDLKPANVLLARGTERQDIQLEDKPPEGVTSSHDGDQLPWKAKITDFGLAKRLAFGDLDGDGIADVLLPAEVPGEELQFEIRAVSGKTGTTLWSRRLDPARSLTAPMMSTAARIDDLDGDGRNEAIVLEFLDHSDAGVTGGNSRACLYWMAKAVRTAGNGRGRGTGRSRVAI